MTDTDFVWDVNVDGSNIAPIALAGAYISYGRVSLLDAPAVPVAVLDILTRDAYPAAGDLYPEFGLGDWASDLSGFVDTYADVYTGVTSRITLGVPVHIDVRTSAGMSDTYEETYNGFASRRFTGNVQAIDYEAGSFQLTCSAKTESWARLLVGGTTASTTIPSEYESARSIRLAAQAGIDLIVDGPPSVLVTEVPRKTAPRPLMDWFREIARDCQGEVFTNRDDYIVVRTRDWERPTQETIYLPPYATLLDPLKMTTELGAVRNYITIEYGPENANGDRPVVTSIDQDSIDRYGRRDLNDSSIIQTQADAQRFADSLNAYLSPHWTMPDATVQMSLLPDEWKARILDAEQGDPVVIPQLLSGSPMADFPGTLLGYEETLGTTGWTMTFHLTPRRNPGITYTPTLIYPTPHTYEGEPQ